MDSRPKVVRGQSIFVALPHFAQTTFARKGGRGYWRKPLELKWVLYGVFAEAIGPLYYVGEALASLAVGTEQARIMRQRPQNEHSPPVSKIIQAGSSRFRYSGLLRCRLGKRRRLSGLRSQRADR